MKALVVSLAFTSLVAAGCGFDPPPDVWMAAGENPNFEAGEPIVLRFSEPVREESLEIRVWSGKEVLYDIEAERNPFDVPILELCTPATSPCHRPFDCSDQDSGIHPRAVEPCDSALDLNCDGDTGAQGCQDCTPFYRDKDGDGYGKSDDSLCLASQDGQHRAVEPGDCDDNDHAVNPGSPEICGNARDDDCDGSVDEESTAGTCGDDDACVAQADQAGCQECVTFYLDADGDTYGDAGDTNCLAGPQGGYRAARAGDCDDGDGGVNPGAEEACNLVDDNCDGRVDEVGSQGCTILFHDDDGDGAGAAGNSKCLCAGSLEFSAASGDDCNDGDYFVHPDADEVCDNAVDDDCDGKTDEDECTECTVFYRDADGDGFGVEADSRCRVDSFEQHTAEEPGDCNDKDAAINPGVPEVCESLGGDCDTPELDICGTGTWFYYDKDGDGHGETGHRQCLCASEGLFTETAGGDCNDSDPAVNPDAPEACTRGSGAGVDENCDGVIDEEDALECTTFYYDNDGDTVGSDRSRCLCAPDGLFNTGEVTITLKDGRKEAWVDVAEGALGPWRDPLVLEVTGNLADDEGHTLNVDRFFDFQIVGGGFDLESCGKEVLPEPLDVVEGPFLFFADFPSPPSPIPLSQQFFSDIQVDRDTGRFVVVLTDGDPLEGMPLNTKDPKQLKIDNGPEGFLFTVNGCMAADKAKGLQFETFPFTLALTIGPIHFELRNNVLRGRIGPDPDTGLAKWDGTMFVQELYMKVADGETFYPPAQANCQLLQLREEEIPENMARVCDDDPCVTVGGSCDIYDPWPPVEVCP